MEHPKVKSVSTLGNRTLLIEFENNQQKTYDIGPLLDKPVFYPLKNPHYFKQVKVEPGGYAVAWDADIDISEHELWRNGVTLESTSRV